MLDNQYEITNLRVRLTNHSQNKILREYPDFKNKPENEQLDIITGAILDQVTELDNDFIRLDSYGICPIYPQLNKPLPHIIKERIENFGIKIDPKAGNLIKEIEDYKHEK